MMTNSEHSPGEARTRQRRRRATVIGFIALVLGVVLGFTASFFDQGDGSLLNGDWEELKLAPGIAIALAIALLAAFVVLPLYSVSQQDDYKREHNLLGYSGGMMGVLGGFPVWLALYAGGFAPYPHAFGIFAIGFVSMMASFLFARFRG